MVSVDRPSPASQQWGPAAHPGQPYPGQYHPAAGPRPPHPPPPAPWPGAGQRFVPAPAPARRSGTGRKPMVLVLVGLVVLALLGVERSCERRHRRPRAGHSGSSRVSSRRGPEPGGHGPDPASGAPSPASSNVTITLPPTIDGRQRLDSPIAKALVDPMREQLVATASADAVSASTATPTSRRVPRRRQHDDQRHRATAHGHGHRDAAVRRWTSRSSTSRPGRSAASCAAPRPTA